MRLASSLSWSVRACAAGARGTASFRVCACAAQVAIFTMGRSLSFRSAYLRMCKPSLAFLFQGALTKTEPPARSLCACVL